MPTPEQIATSGTENAHQTALFAWAADKPELQWLHHIPNGGHRNKIEAARLKAAGVKSGVWDLFLPVPVGNYHGLYIEMKVGTNALTKQQSEFLEHLKANNYKHEVCYDWKQARDCIIDYLNLSTSTI
jgi:hypothetical protein